MHPDDMPLSIESAGPSTAETMEHLREVYSAAIPEIVDRCCAELILPNDQAALCLDVAGFVAFAMCLKVCELRGKPPTRENLMAVWWPFQKSLKDEIPGKLRELADVVATQSPR